MTTSVSAYITPDCSIYTDDGATVCNSYGGCYWNTDYDSCEQCGSTKYSAPGASECTSCSDFAFTEESHKIYNSDPDAGQQGQSECPWLCDANYYKSNDDCVSCPTGSTSPTGSDGPDDCECSGSGQHILLGPDNTYHCGTCPGISTYNQYQCECPSTAQATYENGILISCACTTNATQNGNMCVCDPNGGFPTTTTDGNGVVHCTACSDGATYNTQASACECNAKYYDDGQTCTRCPPGTTKTTGGSIITTSTGTVDASISISDCHMSSATKFCTGSGNDKKCMQLIPSNATNINQSGS